MSLDTTYGPDSYGTNSLVADVNSLSKLKYQAGQNSPEAIKETAKQFASLFNRELIKSMRDASMKSGMFDNPTSDLGNDLLDQQIALQMSSQPGGVADMIAKQLTQMQANVQASAQTNAQTSAPSTVDAFRHHSASSAHTPAHTSAHTPTQSQADFVQKHSSVASQVEKATGIPASFMLGQAGHETAWGQHEIRQKNGASAHNLFGIKATSNWTGKVAEVTTTEYVNGTAQKRVAKFRAYDSYADSFKDYAKMINESPRFAQVKMATGSVHAFASGLQKAGYATDPEYASKISRAINTTQQLRRVQT